MLSFDVSIGFPIGTVLINIIGSFIIGYFGTLTLHSGNIPASENVRLFVMVGICGGFTTFSSFSLQTFDLIRSGAWGRVVANVVLVGSVVPGRGRRGPSSGAALGYTRSPSPKPTKKNIPANPPPSDNPPITADARLAAIRNVRLSY